MRFEVPQFIEIEDKIFGPLTWKQFVYLLGGAGALFMLFVTLPFLVFLVVAAPVASLSAALAFYTIDNQPFIVILESFVRYIGGSRLYLWKKSPPKAIKRKGDAQPVYLPPQTSTLASLSRKLEIHALTGKK